MDQTQLNQTHSEQARALALVRSDAIVAIDRRFKPIKADWPFGWVNIVSAKDPIFCRAARDANGGLTGGVIFYFSRSGVRVRADGALTDRQAVALLCARLAEKEGCAICRTRLWELHRTTIGGMATFSSDENEVLFFETDAVEEGRGAVSSQLVADR